MANRLMQFFTYGHLPPDLRAVSKQCADLAKAMDDQLPETAEKTAGMRKLMEAKDCFVRAVLEASNNKTAVQEAAERGFNDR